jgi:hypothetical protein
VRQAVAAEACLNAARSALFTASVRSTAEFDRPLRRVVRDMLLPRTLEGAILASNHRETGECRLKRLLIGSLLMIFEGELDAQSIARQ